MVLSLDGLGQDKLQAYFSYSTFYAPGKGPYIETYLSVNGKSAVYAKNDDDKTKARIEVTYIFMQGEVVKQFDKVVPDGLTKGCMS